MGAGFKAGLEDVVAANSAICDVDGTGGRLRYRGYDIGDLAERASYEEVAYLLWFGELPGVAALQRFAADLAGQRQVAADLLEAIRRFPRAAHPLEALRSAVSLQAMFDPDARDIGREATLRKSTRLTAQMATLVAALGALKGPRHGGANEDVVAMKAETDLPVNVDFYSAVIYRALGIPIDLCTSVFAVARVAGWCAHVMEQYDDNRPIRPRAHYVGVAPRPFVSLSARA